VNKDLNRSVCLRADRNRPGAVRAGSAAQQLLQVFSVAIFEKPLSNLQFGQLPTIPKRGSLITSCIYALFDRALVSRGGIMILVLLPARASFHGETLFWRTFGDFGRSEWLCPENQRGGRLHRQISKVGCALIVRLSSIARRRGLRAPCAHGTVRRNQSTQC